MHRLIEQFPLERGAHPTRSDGMCAMEMVSWLAGEPHSDEPQCTCPVMAAFVRACNDIMDDEQRNLYLRPLVPLLINTRATPRVERARGLMVLDALVRRFVPSLLRHNGQNEAAEIFSSFGPVLSPDRLAAAGRELERCGADLHAAQWVVQRALDRLPPQRFVAGVVQIIRLRSDATVWIEAAELIEAMAALGQPERQPASAD